jgi:superfamily II DNA or RNA helicase
MPLSAIKEAAGRGARIGALEQAGLRTVADVLLARPHQVHAVPGVGERTAEQVTQAARAAAAAVHRAVRFRFDPDRRTSAQAALLATLAALRAADAAHAQLHGDLTHLLDLIAPLTTAAERAGSRWSMFFSRRATKEAALSALAQLDEILAAQSTQELMAELQRRERATDPEAYDPNEQWCEYGANAAAVNAVLSTIGEEPSDDDGAAQGFVPDEVRQRIVAVPLDTSLLRPTTTLRGYQVFGAQHALHQGRSMLGDEMGLGKTLQALAALGHIAAHGQRRFLVVCPASVQINWLNETAKHTHLATHSLHGPDREAAGRRWMREGGVAVTTFGTLARLPEDVRGAEIAMLVVDEAHFIKNPEAARSRSVRAVAERAQRALFLTGTPMENRVEEFRALVDYLQPRVAARIDSRDALGGARAFRRAVTDVYLRRNQDDVLQELPEKIETESWVQPGPSDESAYRNAVRSKNLMAMRQATFSSSRSAKLERLLEIVDEAEQDGMKVVVFSYFLEVLNLIGRALDSSVVGRIDGSVSPNARQQTVDNFTGRPGHAVLLAQIEAGGVGINVQAASVVVLTEPQWKPSTEEQAIARAHRMGQVRPVHVHRLLAKDSIDERIQEIQQGKRLLFDAFARRSEAKESDRRAVDTSDHRPEVLDDESVPVTRRVLLAEQHRLRIA